MGRAGRHPAGDRGTEERERIARALLPLQARRKEPIAAVLPSVLDRLWTDVLRDSFEAAFSRLAAPEPARGGGVERVEFTKPGDVLR